MLSTLIQLSAVIGDICRGTDSQWWSGRMSLGCWWLLVAFWRIGVNSGRGDGDFNGCVCMCLCVCLCVCLCLCLYLFVCKRAFLTIVYVCLYHHLQARSVHCRTKALACCLQRSRSLPLVYQFTLPQYCCSSSLHLFRCLPRFILSPMGVQTVRATLHLLSVLHLMWLDHVHFLFLLCP